METKQLKQAATSLFNFFVEVCKIENSSKAETIDTKKRRDHAQNKKNWPFFWSVLRDGNETTETSCDFFVEVCKS